MHYEAPTTDASSWNAVEFFAWAQSTRIAAGQFGEKFPPHLSRWYGPVLLELNGDVERLKQAWARFGESKYWENSTPAYPFTAFMRVWEQFVPSEAA